jgi:pilus assembly protein Flp/PilA
MDYILRCLVGDFQTNGGNCMNKFMTMARRFREDEDGAAMVEYSILVGVIAAASILAILAIGGWASARFGGLCDNLAKVGGTTCVKGTGAAS